jgi:CheY-like chemotaxis protein
VGNAIKFTERGSVSVRVTRDSTSPLAPHPSPLVRFEVRDSGIGIPADVQPRLFQPFTQADSSTTRKYGGTGLGLAISRRLVDLMGGTIGVESEPGQGSTFWFTAPLLSSQPERQNGTKAAAARPETTVSTPGQQPVLVVDDNPINRKVAARIAERLGFAVDTAADGQEAVEAAARRRYAAILMDCQMPGLDGYEATAAIRSAEPPGQHTPIIALTANAFAGIRDQCLAAGMDDYLTKPTTVNTVAAALSRWVRPSDRPASVTPAATPTPPSPVAPSPQRNAPTPIRRAG